ncbi:LOW QUALITY PROTEIN: uncharacterized protein LOC110419804 [Herrania umbratica]|uniref:LOW QUALITY PROTEIN: uncharacterized protein LOC110419804 n=1 Tax=Herrania umbratica TaxID=108875 RepID=A0A6J1AP19_9ROSI|nr:LOW QUALITY PROTEIN: uncharacterized protein LOC110419804 [Herrania umbratica]
MLVSSRIFPLPSLTSTLPNFTEASPYSTTLIAHNFIPWRSRKEAWTPRTVIKVSSSSSSSPLDNQTAVIVPSQSQDDATEVVTRFYAGINARDLASVEPLIAEKCVYEDLIFPRPFVGRKAILDFFKSFIDSISMDLQFVIDDISAEDSCAVGVAWHLEWKGRAFPFSKGCSFYRLEMVDGKRQIIYGRDVVEPAIKPGEAALGAIRAVTWLLKQFPQLADQL